FDRALLEMGPVQLNIPRDYFYGEYEYEIPSPIRIERGSGGRRSLDEAAAAIADAKFPVIIAGGGVIMADGFQQAIALAETLDAPVCNSYLHNDSFPARHRLACGPLGYHGSKAAMHVINQADVVIALGSRLGPFGVLPQYGFDYWPKNARLIQVDADAKVLGLVKKTDITIWGDAREVALALTARLKEMKLACKENKAERDARVQAAKDTWAMELHSWDAETDAWSKDVSQGSSYMHPRQMLRELEKAMPEHAMVSTDIGNICQVANSYLKFQEPRSMFGAMMFGNCGYAFPTMIGCKLAALHRPAFAYVSDGAWGISFNELLTCAREKIGVTVCLFNNEQWGAEKKNHVDFYSNRFLGVNLENPSFAAIAKAFGCEGVRVDKLSDVGPALRDSVKAQQDGKTTVIELMCTKELGDPFRRDALQVPKRSLAKYQAFQ